jgi:hypothetical protein
MQAKQLGLPLSLKSIHRMMQMNDMTEMDFDDENNQIEDEAESLIGTMVHGANIGDVDASFLDTPPDGGTGDPMDSTDTIPPTDPAPTLPPNNNVPIKPHTRGSPVPLKRKVGAKGASAKK